MTFNAVAVFLAVSKGKLQSPTLILIHAWDVQTHVSMTELLLMTAAKSRFNVLWLRLTRACNLVQGEGAVSHAAQHPTVKRSNSLQKLHNWLRKLKPSKLSRI